MQQSIFHDQRHNSKPFGLGGTIKPGKEMGHGPTKIMTTLFVEKPLALPESSKKFRR